MIEKTFIFKNYAYDWGRHQLFLHYGFADGPDFTEEIHFPPPRITLTANIKATLDRAFKLIFLLAGASYYKAFAPQTVECRAFKLDSDLAAFIQKTYRKGLAEFAFRNGLDLTHKIIFSDLPSSTSRFLNAPETVSSAPISGTTALVPVGGGKDSIVTIEKLKASGKELILFALGSAEKPAEPIAKTIEMADLPSVYVKRVLDKHLFELNKSGAYNGHVPITAILSAIVVATALMQGCQDIVLSNEHSANAPNISLPTHEVNHQYSKSMEFEQDFATIVQQKISPDLHYFSFLRPLTEIAIAQRFSQLTPYHPIFRSCNTAFRQDEKSRNKNWCCNCPKCRFVFLCLAPFLGPEKLQTIFGHNLLADPQQEQGFAELCGLSHFKPFECVGEVEESAAVVQYLSLQPEWRDLPLVQSLNLKIGEKFGPPATAAQINQKFQSLLQIRSGHRLPPEYLRILECTPKN